MRTLPGGAEGLERSAAVRQREEERLVRSVADRGFLPLKNLLEVQSKKEKQLYEPLQNLWTGHKQPWLTLSKRWNDKQTDNEIQHLSTEWVTMYG